MALERDGGSTPSAITRAKPSAAAKKLPAGASGPALVGGAVPATYALDGSLTEWALEGGPDSLTVGVDARRPDRPTVTQREEPLAEPVTRLGDVEVVLSYGSIATLRAGKLVTMSSFSKPDATTKRGPSLHLFRYAEGGFNWLMGHYPPAWSVAAVRPDGSVEEVADEGVDPPGFPNAWDDPPQTFHAPDWTSFGMRGQRRGKPKTVTWRWSAAQGRYTVEAQPPQEGP